MDWATLTLVIPIARWAKKQFDVATREKRAQAKERDVVRREEGLNDLIGLRDHNIEHMSDLVFIEPDSVSYSLGRISKMANMQFLITNRSIFNIKLDKFIVRPQCESQELSTVSEVEERKIVKQSATAFTINYDLQLPTAQLIEEQLHRGQGIHWQFQMHGYFHSEVGDFEVTQNKSLTTYR
ncbi:hypothetical protein ACFLVS_04945 [Chloroflexota bacterium]